MHPWFCERPLRPGPWVMAHQGGLGTWPSNTMLAFEEAHKLGVDRLDMDVHLSRDGVMVAIHDETVEATTNGRGAVRDMTLAELQSLDAGYRFTQDGRTFPYRGKGVRIPTLAEILETFPERHYVIEVKRTDPKAAGILGELLRQYGLEERALIGSFDHGSILNIRRHCPRAASCASQREVTIFYVLSLLGLQRFWSPPFDALAIPTSHYGLPIVTRRLVQAARRMGVYVLPWTINEPAEMRKMLELRVDGINTDYPARLLEMITGRA